MPQAERHQIDAGLVEMAMAQLKQLQQEASASYTQQTDTGTRKEQTAFETSVKIQQVNAMMSGLLMTAFIYETQSYREICRRFCLQKSIDPDIIEFQEWAKRMKIPRAWLDAKLWEVEPVTPLGMGNPAMAQAEAQQLMGWRGAYPPEAQNEILHEATLVVTGDARKAARWAPLGKGQGVTDAQRDAQAMFGTLMQGVPVPPKQGFSPIEQIETLLPLLAGVVVRCTKRDNTATPDEAAGMGAVMQYIGQLIGQLASDPEQKQRVKQYSDGLGQLANQIKGLAQRGAEKAQSQNGGGNPELAAKMQATVITAKTKAAIAAQKAQQTARHKEKGFVAQQRREDAATFARIQRESAAQNGRMKSEEE